MTSSSPASPPPAAAPELPPGWGPIFRTSPLLDHLGGFHSRGQGSSLQVALAVRPVHANARGQLHGGVLATLADTGLGYLLAFATEPPRRLVTQSLTVDYVNPAAVGDLVEVLLDSSDGGGRSVVATGHLRAGERVVARVRASFVVVAP